MNELDVFAAALQHEDKATRAAFLDQACQGDSGLRERVEILLRNNDEASSFLECPAQKLNGTIEFQPIEERPGSRIGPYRLMEQIGEGGFGLVFVAEQSEPMRRKVALKVIKPGMDTRQITARFQAERQALALMDHPNIAKVLDGGATESGRPYFVMELVRGIPITDYCDQNQLTPRERLGLFVSVCQAVQHAHQKGIIHRDIKPSNVMVTLHDGNPVAKVIDFGVAKAINQHLTERTIYTQFAQMVGTPLYMSPEQAEMSGLDIDTRSDIYSLGVLLYELLTGTTPFDKKRFAKAAHDEIRGVIREEEPPMPSTRLSQSGDSLPSVAAQRKTEPGKLSSLMRGELDWIVMKCLEKNRSRRYETANGLARDLQRYLADEVVEARPPSFGYRAAKILRRNKGPFAAVSLVLLVLLAGIAGTTFGLIKAREKEADALAAADREREAKDREVKQRAQAEHARDQARKAVDDYFTLVSENRLLKSPLPGLQPLRKDLLDAALNYYRGFVVEYADDPGLRAELARAYVRSGQITADISSFAEARQAYGSAMTIWRQLVREHPDDIHFRRDLANCCRLVGKLISTSGIGSRDEALRLLEEARELYQSVVLTGDDHAAADLGLAECFNSLDS
jgi:serine/threonine protein kinase